MRTHSSFTKRSIHALVSDHEDIPALHAGFFVFSFLASALFHLGFFAFLIMLRIALDIVKFRERERRNLMQTAEGVFRSSLVSLSLLSFGYAFSLLLHPSIYFGAAVSGFPLAIFTISRGIGVTLPKLYILFDFLHTFFYIGRYVKKRSKFIGTSFSIAERASLLLLLSSLLLIFVMPIVLPLDADAFMYWLLVECIPWKL